MPLIIGIDPGITGALAFIWPDGEVGVRDIPVEKRGGFVERQVDVLELANIIRNVSNHHSVMSVKAVLERVDSRPAQGSASIYSIGDTCGAIRGVLAGLGIPVDTVRPQEWKPHYGLGKDKEDARMKAIELFPNVELSRKKDHNRAEALLIANYYLLRG